jgi:hypothetical protein
MMTLGLRTRMLLPLGAFVLLLGAYALALAVGGTGLPDPVCCC